MENNTAKNFVLQLGSLVTLYLSVSFWIVLLFSIINLIFPDAVDSRWQIESNGDSLKIAIAMLIVFFPTYLLLTRKVSKVHRQETNYTYLGLTKWLIYLSLLIGGGVLLGDLVAVILAFLNGEITTRFILKALVLLVIIGAAFYYYLQETKGYWLSREKQSKQYALLMIVLVTGSIAFGFTKIENPTVTRELKLDQTQITDLQNMQWQIESALSISSSTLPSTLEEAYGEISIPVAPEGREDYSYKVTDKGFDLCATFYQDSYNDDMLWGPAFDKEALIQNGNNWQYKAGRYCFERVVKK
jgi:hypothetical protein